jgi:hypothetical protein
MSNSGAATAAEIEEVNGKAKMESSAASVAGTSAGVLPPRRRISQQSQLSLFLRARFSSHRISLFLRARFSSHRIDA